MREAQLIKDNLFLPLNEFQIFLQQIHEDDHQFYHAMIIAMLENNIKENKQKLATGLNFLTKRFFRRKQKNPEIWHHFHELIVSRPVSSRAQQLLEDWKLHKITQKSFEQFLCNFNQQFGPIMQNFYFSFNFDHKILMQSLIPNADIGQQNKVQFLYFAFENYISLGLQHLVNIQNFEQKNQLEVFQKQFSQYLNSIKQTMQYLKQLSQDSSSVRNFLKKISYSQQLFNLANRCIYFKIPYESQNKSVFILEGSYSQQQIIHSIKSFGLQILTRMLVNFDKKSTMQDFDSVPALGLMETLTPHLVTEMTTVPIKKITLHCNEALGQSILMFLSQSIKFNFMHEYFWHNYRHIFFNIIYPLLGTSSEQARQAASEPEDFIAQAETLVQKFQDEQQKVESCKTYAGFLLQKIITQIDGSLTALGYCILQIIQFTLNGKNGILASQAKNEYKITFDLQICLTVLLVLSFPIRMREDIKQRIRRFLMQDQGYLKLKGVQKARLIIYLSYNFQQLFKFQSESTRIQLYQWVSQSLQQSELMTKCVLMFITSYYDEQPCAVSMMRKLFQLIPSTKSVDILETIASALKKSLCNMEHSEICSVARMLVDRTKNDNIKHIESVHNNQVNSNICMIKCVQAIRVIVKYAVELNDQAFVGEILSIIQPTFQLMQHMPITNCEQNLLKLFLSYLKYPTKIHSQNLFKFLPYFAQHHRNHKEIGILFDIYQQMLLKSNQYFLTSGSEYLLEIVDNLLLLIAIATEGEAIGPIVLLQYIIIQFMNLPIQHSRIYQCTSQLLDGSFSLTVEQRVSVFCLWVIGSAYSSQYSLDMLHTLSLENVQGYHAKMFAEGIRLKVLSLSHEIAQTHDNANVDLILMKIKYLLSRAALFIKNYNPIELKYSKSEYKILGYDRISPSAKIRETLLYLKNFLKTPDYEEIIREIENQVPKQQLKIFLNKVGKEERVFYSIK